MKLTIIVDDELAQENIRKLWINRINVTEVVNKMLANLKFEFKYDFEPVTIQETVTKYHKLELSGFSGELVTK